jgi:hypothetical protein
LGLALGGRPAASFAKRLMLPVSNDTLLRGTGGGAACDGRSATSPVPPILRAMTQPRTGQQSELYPSSESNILR